MISACVTLTMAHGDADASCCCERKPTNVVMHVECALCCATYSLIFLNWIFNRHVHVDCSVAMVFMMLLDGTRKILDRRQWYANNILTEHRAPNTEKKQNNNNTEMKERIKQRKSHQTRVPGHRVERVLSATCRSFLFFTRGSISTWNHLNSKIISFESFMCIPLAGKRQSNYSRPSNSSSNSSTDWMQVWVSLKTE